MPVQTGSSSALVQVQEKRRRCASRRARASLGADLRCSSVLVHTMSRGIPFSHSEDSRIFAPHTICMSPCPVTDVRELLSMSRSFDLSMQRLLSNKLQFEDGGSPTRPTRKTRSLTTELHAYSPTARPADGKAAHLRGRCNVCSSALSFTIECRVSAESAVSFAPPLSISPLAL